MPPVGFEPTISAGVRPAAARLLRSWVRIPPGAWIFVCCECRVLSGRGLCDELIARPEEYYRLCCVVVCDLETSRIGAPCIYDNSSLRVNTVALFVVNKLFLGMISLPAIRFPLLIIIPLCNRLSLKTGTRGLFSPQNQRKTLGLTLEVKANK